MVMQFQSTLLLQIPYVTHGFFTRQGGVGTLYHQALSVSTQDSNAHSLQENIRRIEKSLGAEYIHFDIQDHTTKIREIDTICPPQTGDGLICQTKGFLIGVKTADCMPILMAHPRIPIVAAVHAGWKGLLSGIIQTTLDDLSKLCLVSELYCAIGPCIAANHLNVGLDVYDKASFKQFFYPGCAPNKWLLDMPAYASHILHGYGVTHVDHICQDTYSQPDIFFSYRRSIHQKEPIYGLQASVIGIKK